MSFKKPRDHFSGRDAYWAPIWQYIGRDFLDHLNAQVGDTTYNSAFYIAHRSEDGLTEEDVEEHIRSDSQQPLILIGPAGVGKTTLLHHVTRKVEKDSRYVFVYVDVLANAMRLGATKPEDVLNLVLNVVHGEVERLATETLANFDPLPWWKFLLENWRDPHGIGSVLLHRLRSNEPIGSTEGTRLTEFLGAIPPAESLPLRLKFLRMERNLRPVIVIDNVDRLTVRAEPLLMGFVISLAMGTRPESNDHAVTLMAMRPETLEQGRSPQTATNKFRAGSVSPPRIGLVLHKRLEMFLEGLSKKVSRKDEVVPSRGIKISAWAEAEAEPIEVIVRRVINHLTTALTTGSSFETLADSVLLLTNFNIRLTLLAVAGYVSSGHHDWDRLLDPKSSDEAIKRSLTRPKIFRALLLGPRSVFQGSGSWAQNIFEDGRRDTVGVLITLRILKYIHISVQTRRQHEGVSPSLVADDLNKLFLWDRDRIVERIDQLWRSTGLLEEWNPGYLRLTAAGRTYLTVMTRDFEYLQHVLVDTPTAPTYLVECRERDEPASIRVERVLKFAKWVWSLEVDAYQSVVNGCTEELYRKCFTEDTISGSLAETIVKAFPRLPGAQEWGHSSGMREESEKLARLSKLEEIKRQVVARGATNVAQG